MIGVKGVIPVVSSLFFLVCAGNRPTSQVQFGINLVSREVKNQLKEVAESVVSMQTDVKYNVQKFNYALDNGQFVPDRESPVGYKLEPRNGDSGVMVEQDQKTLSGGALIIGHDFVSGKYTLLTSSHLVAPQDTTDLYYLDEDGAQTDALFARYIVTDVLISVRVGTGRNVEADLICRDGAIDLAVIEVQKQSRPGTDFRRKVGYSMDLSWGDWVFIFGYPHGVKQLTGGWVSRGPYRSTLAVDAVVRFGYSGGAVLAVDEDNQELVFVGLIKSVPRSTFDYVGPDERLPVGYPLGPDDIDKLVVKSQMMVDYGTAYFVHPKTVKKFFERKRPELEAAGIRLSAKYYGR